MGFNIGADPESVIIAIKTGAIRSIQSLVNDPDKLCAIGKDGNRNSASLEFRPGMSPSGEELVNRLGDLINTTRELYHPPGISYRCGAWVHPEPLGGHIHLSWLQQADPLTMQNPVEELLTGLSIQSGYLIPKFFDKEEITHRYNHAVHGHHDYAKPKSIRPHTMEEVLDSCHVEYRYPPSWLLTPEMAYCFLGGAEVIARLTLEERKQPKSWMKIITELYEDKNSKLSTVGSLNLAEAFSVAVRFLDWKSDYSNNWVV